MATVYRAHDTVLNRAVAIKVLDPALSIDPKAVERFKREAVTAANLEHPNIVRVYDVQQEGNLHYIAMRYVQGTTLRDVLQDNGPLALETAVNVVLPVAQALHYAHKHGVIHRDVKPGNILVEPDGSVVLSDFGIARAASAQAGLTATGLVMGTADYLSPEQISGRPAESRSDIYSLGVVLYEMLTGVTPFAGENTASILYRQVHDAPPPLRSMNPRLPQELQPIIDRALAKNPSLRYSDALDLARDLEEVARWLPQGGPWLKNKPASNGAGNATRYVPQPAGGYVSDAQQWDNLGQQTVNAYADEFDQPYEVSQPFDPHVTYTRSPQEQGRGRRTMLLFFALLLVALGAIVMAAGAGVLPFKVGQMGQGGTGGASRFELSGPVTYRGPVRAGNGPDIRAPRALQPLVIDGDLSDWAGAEQWAVPAFDNITFINPQVPNLRWEGPQDLSATFHFAWDDTNFYIGTVVTDDAHVQTDTTRGYSLYHGDDIEIWFDLDLAGDFDAGTGNADDFQLGLSPGDFAAHGPEAVFWNPDRQAERNKLVTVRAQRRPASNGYVIEAAVPWIAFGEFRPQPGTGIGFVASAGDNDNPAGARQELMTSTGNRLQYKQPPTFGMLYL